jgi:hypothetical protein
MLRKTTEADKVVVPKFPALVQLPHYGVNLGHALVQASSFNDCAELRWLHDTAASTFELLASSGEERFASLDIKLATALIATIKDHAGARQLMDELQNFQRVANFTVVKGRQIYWMILNFYRTTDCMDLAFGVEHMSAMKWRGDSGANMYASKVLWDNITRQMVDKLADRTLRELLLRKMKDSFVSKEDLGHYDRLPVESIDRNIDFLWRCINRAFLRKKEKPNAEAQEKAMKGEICAPAPGGPELTDKQKAKEKEKQKKAKEKEKREKEALLAAPAPGPSPKAGGKGAGGGADGVRDHVPKPVGGDAQTPCWFFKHMTCTKTPCAFAHITLSKAEKAKMVKPARSGSPKGGGKGAGAKGGGKQKGGSRDPSPAGASKETWCHLHLTPRRMHLRGQL